VCVTCWRTPCGNRSTRPEAGLDTVDDRRGIGWLVRILITGGSKYTGIAPTPAEDPDGDEGVDRQVAEPIRTLIGRGIADGSPKRHAERADSGRMRRFITGQPALECQIADR
jgi:hypothetical protein